MFFRGDPYKLGWASARLVNFAPVVVTLAGYGAVRLGLVAWTLGRGGLPRSVLGWSGAISGLAAAAQAIVLAVLLVVVWWCRPRIARISTAAGVGAAVVDAALWVLRGSAAHAEGYAWRLVLAAMTATSTLVLCRVGFRWVRLDTGYFDLSRIAFVLLRVAAAATVVAAAGGGAMLMVDKPEATHRLANVVTDTALLIIMFTMIVWLNIIAELRGRQHRADIEDIYRRLSDNHDNLD